ncbi:PAS domain-containing protein [uncultured Aquimarina sp.]|uniref:PAS domain-containing sensor histidine kinase n=1 Tax=uncultured Aquimarina sp. TaxID=575652 RepID=UPI00262BECA6|nr:PAS domain-containing protein [uncultured Aquimarina sp.]
MKLEKKIDIDPILDNGEHYLQKELYDLVKKESSIFDFLQVGALDGLWFWDLLDPENVWMNSSYWTTFGYDPKKMPHKVDSWQDIVFKEDLKNVYANFASHAEDPTCPYDQIVRFRHKLGHTVWVRCRGMMLRDKNGKPVKMLGAHTDITNIKIKEEELKLQSAFFEHIIDGTGLGTWKWNVKTGETVFNERWAEIIGYSLSELEPVTIDTWMEYSHQEDLEKSNKLLQEHFSGKTSIYECEARMKHKNGEYVWVLDKGKVVSWDDQGNPEWMIGSHQEITDRKKAYEKNRLFIEQAPTAIAMFDTNMRYLATSLKWIEDYNIQDKNIIGKSHYEVFPEIGDRWKADHQECLTGKILKSDEDRFERLDGSIQWITWELRPWYINDEEIGGILMYTADITRMKLIESELRKSEEDLQKQMVHFEHVIEGTGLGTWQWNVKTGETILNERWAEMIGYSLSELEPISLSTWLEHSTKEDQDRSNKLLKDHFLKKTPFYECEFKMKHKNGEWIWVLDKGKVVSWDSDGNPEWMVGSHQEITEKKKDFERNRLFIEQTPSAIAMLDYKMNYLAASQKWLEVYEIEDIEIIGKSYYEIFSEISEARKTNIVNCLKGNVVKNYEEKIETKSGKFKWLSWELRPWYSNENEIGGLLIHVSDITRIKKEEELKSLLKVAEDQNRRLKNFAHIVSHNLKSHSGNFEMLLDLFLQENPEIEDNEIIKLFKTASSNLSDTIAHLNEVVLINTSLDKSLVPIQLKDVVDEVVRGIAAIALESKVEINNLVDDDIDVLAIPAYLDSILLNFITNGIKYRSRERKSHITLSAVKNRKYVVLSIEDNGLGIDLVKHRSKLFGMYKTFHPNIKNSRGIGLFITKNQVEAIGGKIEVISTVNQGTTFKIYMKYEKN